MDSISIIVPAHNNASTIRNSLQSIEEAINYFQAHLPQYSDVGMEIVVVDDGSTDGTAAAVADAAAGKSYYKIVQGRHRSAASSRNAGVEQATGSVLFFLDGDDLFLPPHLFECYRALVRHNCGYIRSLIRIADGVHPDWHDAIANSSMINLCVRRECHDFLGGVPDFHLFSRHAGGFRHLLNLCPRNEDVYYNQLLVTFFHGYRVQMETAEYLRYPGNSLDRQLAKFQQPWGAAVSDNDTPDEKQRQLFAAHALKWYTFLLTQKKAMLEPSTLSPSFKL
jgi:glycosyltransferase involved in cell wall biosynthesis